MQQLALFPDEREQDSIDYVQLLEDASQEFEHITIKKLPTWDEKDHQEEDLSQDWNEWVRAFVDLAGSNGYTPKVTASNLFNQLAQASIARKVAMQLTPTERKDLQKLCETISNFFGPAGNRDSAKTQFNDCKYNGVDSYRKVVFNLTLSLIHI